MSLTSKLSHLEHRSHEMNSRNAVSFYCGGVGFDVANHHHHHEDEDDDNSSTSGESTCSSSSNKEYWSDVDDEALMFVPCGFKSPATIQKTKRNDTDVVADGCNGRRYSHPITVPKLCHPRDDEAMPSNSIVPISETTMKTRPPRTTIF